MGYRRDSFSSLQTLGGGQGTNQGNGSRIDFGGPAGSDFHNNQMNFSGQPHHLSANQLPANGKLNRNDDLMALVRDLVQQILSQFMQPTDSAASVGSDQMAGSGPYTLNIRNTQDHEIRIGQFDQKENLVAELILAPRGQPGAAGIMKYPSDTTTLIKQADRDGQYRPDASRLGPGKIPCAIPMQ